MRKLKADGEMTVMYSYSPEDVTQYVDPSQLTIVTVYPPPLFIMSPRIRVYKAADIKRFKGFLSKFEPSGSKEGEEPFAVLTVTPVEVV